MKILKLRKKIIASFSVAGILFLAFVAIIFLSYYEKKSAVAKVELIKSDTAQIENQISELETKTVEIKKYQGLWKNLSGNKKNTAGIKMDEINSNLALVAEKYSIFDPVIKVALPETLKDGVFKRATVSVLSTNVSLSFSSADDVMAISFVTEFLNSIPGYVVVTNLELRKSKSYTDKDLIEISSGKNSAAVNGKVDFFWYAYKEKSELEKKINPEVEDEKKSAE